MRTLLLPALALALSAQTPELRVTAADRTALSITIYQNDLAMVRDTRRMAMPAGMSRLVFADVAATIRPKSAYLLDPGHGLTVLERNFEFDLLTPESLRLASLGEPAASKNPLNGSLRWGTQASVPWPRGLMNPNAPPLARMARRPQAYFVQPSKDVLIRRENGFEPESNPTYRSLPPALRASPAVVQTLSAQDAGARDLCLLYTATGLSWEPHYIATLSTDGSRLDLNAFATVENKSGIDYPTAAFQLVAGEPNLVPDPDPHNAFDGPAIDQTSLMTAANIIGPPVFQEARLSEYPIFTLDRPTTLRNGQRKQLALFESKHLPIAVTALVAPGDQWFSDEIGYLDSCRDREEPPRPGPSPIPLSVGLLDPGDLSSFDEAALENLSTHEGWLSCHRPPVALEGEIKNIKANRLGRALPAGSLDLRYRTPEGATIPMGSSDVDPTPAGESLRIPLGVARGFGAERKTLTLRRVSLGDQAAWELELTVTVTNRTSKAMKTLIREPIFGNWTLIDANLKGHRSGENAYDFELTSRPHSSFTLRYRVRTDPVDPQESS